MLAAILALVLHPPVDGAILRVFDPGAHRYATGGHRGMDFAVRAGGHVHAACGGRVTFAGRTPAGQAVTIRCGAHQVTHVGVAPVVRTGAPVPARARIGIAHPAPGHTGLHLGLRPADDSTTYLDPSPFLRAGPAQPVLAPRARPRPFVGPRAAPRSPARPRAAPRPRAAAPPRPRTPPEPASWPVLAGLALITAALPAVAMRARARARRRGARAALPQPTQARL